MMHPFATVSFTRKVMPIRTFRLELEPITNCSPISQRLPVYVSVQNKKNEAIIRSILWNIDIGNITLCDVKDAPCKFHFESLDGGHRKRAIIAFMNGEFTVDGAYFSELSDEQKEKFLNYELSFTLYGNLTNEMKGYIFRSLNETTHVNTIEMLNSYGNTPIANAVRETVRVVPDINGKSTVIHELFKLTASGNFEYVDDSNLRLKQEEYVARVYYSFYKGGKLCNRSTDKIQEMYDDPNLNTKLLKKKADKFFNFLAEMAKSRKGSSSGGLQVGEKNALLNLYLYLSDSFGADLEATNYLEWWRVFSEVYKDLYHDPKGKFADVQKLPFEAKDSTLSQLFCDYSRNHDSAEKQKQMVIWMTDHPAWDRIYNFTLLRDRNRAFPVWMKEIALQNQGYVCYVDGLPLDWADAEAGHIDAHALGGKTELSNCAMIRKSHNSAMGTMNVNEYKKHFLLDKTL